MEAEAVTKMTIDEQIVEQLRGQADGLPLDRLEDALAQGAPSTGPGVVECILRLSGRYQIRGDRWLRKSASKLEKLMAAISEYAEASARGVFKAETALRDLSPEEKPTREELAIAVGSMNGFTLLKNDMIKVER